MLPDKAVKKAIIEKKLDGRNIKAGHLVSIVFWIHAEIVDTHTSETEMLVPKVLK